jgi:hypothetical protein
MGKKLFNVMAVVLSATVVLTACSSTADTTDAADTASASVSAGGEVERGASESESRTVAIVNNTGSDITLSISGTDNFDWEGSRPDNAAPEGFQGTLIASGGTETRGLTTNTNADGAPFTINFGVTGVSVELNTKRDYNTKAGNPESVVRFNGWGQRNDRTECETNTITKDGYSITVECKGAFASPNTTVTITKQ